MNLDQLKQLMDDYANCDHKRELLKSQKAQLEKQIIPMEVQIELESLDAEFEGKEKALDDEEKKKRAILDLAIQEYIASITLKDKIKIKTELLTVSMDKGDIIYDPTALDGYAINHPEILGFRNEKEAKVRITKNKLEPKSFQKE